MAISRNLSLVSPSKKMVPKLLPMDTMQTPWVWLPHLLTPTTSGNMWNFIFLPKQLLSKCPWARHHTSPHWTAATTSWESAILHLHMDNIIMHVLLLTFLLRPILQTEHLVFYKMLLLLILISRRMEERKGWWFKGAGILGERVWTCKGGRVKLARKLWSTYGSFSKCTFKIKAW